ncbi:metallopeptidase family protein [Candidatus Aminicenantes bacterium AC-335-A11]|jgi:predicted Zn-dependent protease with MMP-like domain|nr:metallopeptidase family protein [SCandidatus Aminicenantes bacterium Aminicenantia_JdfR_composite]MCP2596627.1 metallopeptidase family protein [Candidatus Aminicenantes bacterium AC-335-G13]MCP2598047.1 metallopeptidase family protein [Candidatus Aminicenantes bacterium AC-335-L06]MCP2618369.1 metallopeptidase family protein [Candidatus Aminicenantes bacterium AC-335-A11]
MEKHKFEELVEETIKNLPRKFKKYLNNIAIIVEDRPPDTSPHNLVLGIYHGVPLKHRGAFYGNVPPDVIVIYKESIERICRTEDQIKEKIREVILHEIGHYFGFSEMELRKMEED